MSRAGTTPGRGSRCISKRPSDRVRRIGPPLLARERRDDPHREQPQVRPPQPVHACCSQVAGPRSSAGSMRRSASR
jgi:hypothetical protein